ncbi:transposase IS3503g [Corynebacterium jeikeium]|uniref:hypothetical protein n=1 Tax=Corynebacterium jeikeium TaxID=38289 RepID=UPI000053ED9F|nr:hypothetical protein [Corynebacterium jeikeium]SUY85976.1 transposase IS3503g [Corynebacterium jeikeium]
MFQIFPSTQTEQNLGHFTTDLITHNTTATTNDIGAPAEYDTAIDTSYQHNLGIQKGLRVKMCVWLGVSRGLDLAFLNAD